ncbi:MAG TPA: ribonuclease D, partial [Verrucomicrobiae bacterium]|nr:ribonuclease D [Verrucomicrobiae bacterium]
MIDNDEKLAAFLPAVHSATWLALDTEADSLHAYPEKLCLIQISTASGDELVDPLAAINLGALLDALAGHELLMHGADYDLRLLEKHHSFIPGAIFDTMLAARLVGARQFSLSNLVEQYLGVKLEKGAQKANWAMRPLTEKMERYARHDTHYLKPLCDKLREELESKGRLAWHQESCARLIADSTAERPPDPDLWRLKGSHLLGRPALAVLRELWQWREREAIAANRPPFFVLAHQVLVDIAAAAATQRSVTPLLPRHLSERRRQSLRHAIEEGIATPPERQPEILRSSARRPSEIEKQRFAALERQRDHQAAKLGIDPTLIA